MFENHKLPTSFHQLIISLSMMMMTKQMLHWIRFLLDPSRMSVYLHREDVTSCLSLTKNKFDFINSGQEKEEEKNNRLEINHFCFNIRWFVLID